MDAPPRPMHIVFSVVAVFAIVSAAAWGILALAWPVKPIDIRVRWRADVTEADRLRLERRFQFSGGQHSEATTWSYQLVDPSSARIREIVHHERVDDTAHLDRVRYRPEFGQDRSRQILVYSLTIGVFGTAFVLLFNTWAPRTRSLRDAVSWESEPVQIAPPLPGVRAVIAALLGGTLVSVAIARFVGASVASAAAALLVVYACGYVTGSLIVNRVEGICLAVIRTIGGLLLSSVALLLSLIIFVPWFAVPFALVTAALLLNRRNAVVWPQPTFAFRWDGLVAGVLVAILLAPIAITFVLMAPGSFPPVFYNADIGYSLEKVHSVAVAQTFPPPSLSNLGVQRTYHYGTHAMAALISRSSGLLPHHSLFLIVLPLLTAGVIAAAVAVARHVAPAIPRSISVPLLLITTPYLAKPFSGRFATQLWNAAASGVFSIQQVVGDYELWGILSNDAHNVCGNFLILGSVAGLAAANVWGRRLPACLIGVSVLFKTTTGIAIVAGFALAEVWRAIVSKRFLPSQQAVMAAAIFIATFVTFYLATFQSVFRVEAYPLSHLREAIGPRQVSPFVFDLLWLFLPVLIVLSARLRDPERKSAPLLLWAIGPLVVTNTTRLDNTGVGIGGAGAGDDWIQVLHPVPFLLHAFALSLASRRWDALGRGRRAAVLLTMGLMIAPVAAAAASYSWRLLRDPASGLEFVDNRSLGQALALIPTQGSIIVTNDLRYPAQNFSRVDRQMQIPSLFGHQAFAVNYAYEPVEYRRPLQMLLQQPEWSDAILEAARAHRWTHFVVRKDYVHPAPIPLPQVFENADYAVFAFR
jgi:hypothetical protein